MNVTQLQKARRFRALHDSRATFVMPNPWDGGSARVLAGLGFSALATSSLACAVMFGRRDHQVTREEALAHAKLIVEATDLPVSADLEQGFGDAPEEAAQTIRLAADVGLVGGSIEDSPGRRCAVASQCFARLVVREDEQDVRAADVRGSRAPSLGGNDQQEG